MKTLDQTYLRLGSRNASAIRRLQSGTERKAIRARKAAPLIVAVLVYALFLHVMYVIYMVPHWEYIGFRYRPPQMENYVLAIVVAVLVAFTLPRRIQHVSDVLLWLMYVITVAPTILLAQYNSLLSPDRASLLGFHVGASLILTRVVASLRPNLNLDYAAVNLRRYFPLVCAGLIIAIFGYLGVSGELSFGLISLGEVYDQRTQFSSMSRGNVLAGYLPPIFFNVVGPTLMALGLYHRKYWLFFLAASLQLLLYTSIAYKTVLFSIVIIVVLHLVLTNGRIIAGAQLVRAAIIAGVTLSLTDYLLGTVALTNLFVRRFLYIPGVFSSVYASVFWDAGKTNFNDAFPFFASGTSFGSPADVVAANFFHSGVNPSASLYAHGFGSYGFLGMYIETLVFAIILWVIDDCTKSLPLFLGVSVFFMPALALCEASVFAALLTHGFAAAFIIAIMVPRPEKTKEAPSRSSSEADVGAYT